MKKHIYIILALVCFSITSCKKESLQTYLIDSQEKKEFSHISIPSSIIQLSANSVSIEDQKAYKSIEKINLTGLLIKNASEGQYETVAKGQVYAFIFLILSFYL